MAPTDLFCRWRCHTAHHHRSSLKLFSAFSVSFAASHRCTLCEAAKLTENAEKLQRRPVMVRCIHASHSGFTSIQHSLAKVYTCASYVILIKSNRKTIINSHFNLVIRQLTCKIQYWLAGHLAKFVEVKNALQHSNLPDKIHYGNTGF